MIVGIVSDNFTRGYQTEADIRRTRCHSDVSSFKAKSISLCHTPSRTKTKVSESTRYRAASSHSNASYGSTTTNLRTSRPADLHKTSSRLFYGRSLIPASLSETLPCRTLRTGRRCPTIRTVESRIDAYSIRSIFSTDFLLVLCPSRTIQSDYGSPHTSKSIGTQTASYTSRSDKPLLPTTPSDDDITRSCRNSLAITYPIGNFPQVAIDYC